jgi:glutathione S-transferase
LTLWESHAILAYLGEKAGKMWPASAAGRADALRWLFFLSGHVAPPAADLARNRIAVKVVGGKADEDAIARGERALPDVIRIVEAKLAKSKWLLGDDFTLVDCAYAPILNITEKAGFSYEEFQRCVHTWMRSALVRHGKKRCFKEFNGERGRGSRCRFWALPNDYLMTPVILASR